ncbi:MAG TPA: hypothetical protein VIG57_17905 [Candidatus Entotheonella sp.]
MVTHRGAKLKFGIMCDDYHFPAWEAECIKNLISSGYAEPVLLIRDVTEKEREPYWKKIFRHSFLAEMFDMWWLQKTSKALKKVSMIEYLKDVEVIHCSVIQKGKFSQYFNDKDVESIKNYRLDFILRFSFNIIRGEILNAARYGVWSYHHDDDNLYRGGPPCFWEIFHGDPKTGTILQKLTDRLDGGIILHRGYFKTSPVSYVTNLDRAYLGSTDWCTRVCAEIVLGQTDKFESQPSRSQAPIYQFPSNLKFIYFIFKLSLSLIERIYRLTLYIDVWNVGITHDRIEKIVHNGYIDDIEWIKQNKSKHYTADPFAYIDNGKCHILVEDFDYKHGGKISELILPDALQEYNLKPVLQRAHHMSYPYIFSENGTIYCIPETHETRNVCLYKKVDETWEYTRTLIEDLPIVDPVLFRYHDLYWIFCTHQNDGFYGNLKLYAYYAENLESTWQPHPLNPLKCDVSSSRSAGNPIMIGGKLYRPSQDCSETYGGAVVMNEILTLSPTEFNEVPVAHIKPRQSSLYPHGLHTLNALENATIVDSKRVAFDLLGWRKNPFFKDFWD